MNVGRMIAYWEERVARGEAVRVSFGGGRDYKTTEKGDEVDRLRLEELRRNGAFKRLAIGIVPAYAKSNVDVAIQVRRCHLYDGAYSLDEQPDIPGVPRETEIPAERPPRPKKKEERGKQQQIAAQIIVGR